MSCPLLSLVRSCLLFQNFKTKFWSKKVYLCPPPQHIRNLEKKFNSKVKVSWVGTSKVILNFHTEWLRSWNFSGALLFYVITAVFMHIWGRGCQIIHLRGSSIYLRVDPQEMVPMTTLVGTLITYKGAVLLSFSLAMGPDFSMYNVAVQRSSAQQS